MRRCQDTRMTNTCAIQLTPCKLACIVAATAAASSAILLCLCRVHKKTSKRDENPTESNAIYESEASARQYMEFHYTPGRDSYVQRLRLVSDAFDFPLRVAQKFKAHSPTTSSKVTRALDIGCATGASVLEMSKYFDSVIGIDYSEVFIHLARELTRGDGSPRKSLVEYTAPDQGDMCVERSTRAPSGTIPSRCQFFCGDAMELFADDGASTRVLSGRYPDVSLYQVPAGERFDAVLAANLLCRVPDPRRLLDAFGRLLHSGGVLVLASPYSWWEGASAKEKWIGGRTGGPRSEDAVKAILEKDFELLSETDEGFLIRDHVRRYQLGFSHCTVWRRR